MLVENSKVFTASKLVFAFLKYLYENRTPLFNSILDDIGKLEFFYHLERIEKLKKDSFFMFYATFQNDFKIGDTTSFSIFCSLLKTKDTNNEDFCIYLISVYISSSRALQHVLYNYYNAHNKLFLDKPYNPLDKLLEFPNQRYWNELSSAKVDGMFSSGKKNILL